ncbi:MAG: cobalamin biosynthesis protein [Candidatus Adiutrix sp.]|jgi:cobalt-precorrin 5A hydrolase|nr:cobalamin biosynthesis protein [Candidatus Adiutrix sp.]
MAPELAAYALTRPGAALARRLAQSPTLSAALFLPRRLQPEGGGPAGAEYFDRLGECLARNFAKFKGHLIIGACGLTVRLLAPLLTSKKSDPAVVVLSQDGRFAISLLSGHLGGGNDLARRVAAVSGGQAVITTATDGEGLPALEMLAADLGLEVEDFSKLPAVSRQLVEGAIVRVYDPFKYLSPRLEPWADHFQLLAKAPEPGTGPNVRVDFRLGSEADPDALVLRPRVITLGLGCHRRVELDELEELIRRSLTEAGLALKSVAALATVETRAGEPSLLALSRKLGRPLLAYPKAELSRVRTPNPSAKVMEHIGLPSVCEAAALLAAGTGRLIINKRKSGRATLAAALKMVERDGLRT